MASFNSLELSTLSQDLVINQIANNTNLTPQKVRIGIKKGFMLPKVVKNKYTLEAYVIDLLYLIPKKPSLNRLTENDWSSILKVMFDDQGFHLRLLLRIWPLTTSYEFSHALSQLCRIRLNSWKSCFTEISKFHECNMPNFKSHLKYYDDLDHFSQVLKETNDEGLNILDDIKLTKMHWFGKGIRIYSTFMQPFSGVTYSEIAFNPLWVPIGPLNRKLTFGVIPVWMLGWINWEDPGLTEGIMTQGYKECTDLKRGMIKPNLFKDVISTPDERNFLVGEMMRKMVERECLEINNFILDDCKMFGIGEKRGVLLPILEETLEAIWDRVYDIVEHQEWIHFLEDEINQDWEWQLGEIEI